MAKTTSAAARTTEIIRALPLPGHGQNSSIQIAGQADGDTLLRSMVAQAIDEAQLRTIVAEFEERMEARIAELQPRLEEADDARGACRKTLEALIEATDLTRLTVDLEAAAASLRLLGFEEITAAAKVTGADDDGVRVSLKLESKWGGAFNAHASLPFTDAVRGAIAAVADADAAHAALFREMSSYREDLANTDRIRARGRRLLDKKLLAGADATRIDDIETLVGQALAASAAKAQARSKARTRGK